MKSIMWKSIDCNLKELRLDLTLECGQSFRWRKSGNEEWSCVLRNKLWTVKQTDTKLFYKVSAELPKDEKNLHNSRNTKRQKVNDKNEKLQNESDEDIIKNYFQLDVNLQEKYKMWSAADENFKKVADHFPGIRILRQDPIENLLSFICSSNNTITRITSMVEKLCVHFGKKIGELEGDGFYSFPDIETLAEPNVQSKLSDLGFGYRAKYVNQSAKQLLEFGGSSWLFGLRTLSYEEAKQELMKLNGVGPKVADCVCLMSLDKPGTIPIDTHVYQIASSHYLPHLKGKKSLTAKTYEEIGNYFRDLYGTHAGWAHSVLFTSDLPKFKNKIKKA